jgi:diguanylate cyclase (GGDEF)-like protein/PAS domain S-box-containing protein
MKLSLEDLAPAWPILAGFALSIILLSVLWYNSMDHLGRMNDTVQNSRMASEKMELLATLIETARSRTRLTIQMINEEDPFVKDEIGLELDRLATTFATARRQYMDMGLSPQEEMILDHQMQAIRTALSNQRMAAEMAISDDQETVRAAQRLLLDEVYPDQAIIIDDFMQLLALQKNIIFNNTNRSTHEYVFAKDLITYLYLFLVFTALLTAVLVSGRVIRAQKALFLEKERALITLKSIGEAVITTDNKGRVEYLNPVAEKVTGHLTENVQGKAINQIFRAHDQKNDKWVAQCMINFLNTGDNRLPSNDIVLHTADNEKLDISLTVSPINDSHNKVLGLVTTFKDITDAKRLRKRLEHQASHDPLTGLLNRREFERKVSQALSLYTDNNTAHSFLVLDLDRFKVINDSAGHSAGDELLRRVATTLRFYLRKSDLISRLGGDEFAIFMVNTSEANAIKAASGLLKAIHEICFAWGSKSYTVEASIGLINSPSNTSDYEYLYHAADTACYAAKHEGRNRIHTVKIDDVSLSRSRAETEWARKINDALEQDLFQLYAQNITPLDPRDKSQHREVLLRIHESDGTVIAPNSFIPAAERYGLMGKIDQWVIDNIIRHIHNTQDNTLYSINLSGQSLSDTKFITRTLDTLSGLELDHARLCFEITETAAIANIKNAQEFLQKLQMIGCKTALDDFGSGLSSFAYLRNLPIDYLKIDGMFINPIEEDRICQAVVKAIKEISATMQLKTVAEYVETEGILHILRDIGIDYAQGYYFDKPAPL